MASRFHRVGIVLALPAVMGLLLGGCQRAADSLVERASGGKVEIERKGDAVVLKTAEGQMLVQGGDSLPLPKGFPADVYLPEGYAINSVMDLDGVNVLGLHAPGKVSGLFADAREAMAASGWKETMAMQHSVDSAMLAFEKAGDGDPPRSAMLAFNEGGEQGVSLSVQLRSGKSD
jgi:hypothetical protein